MILLIVQIILTRRLFKLIDHGLNSIQLYFKKELIEKIVLPYFNIQEIILIKREDVEHKDFTSRYHLVLTKK